MKILLDTNVLIDVINRRRGRREFVRELVRDGNRLFSCAVTVAEVYARMKAQEAPDTEALLSLLNYVAITSEVARQAGLLKGAWAKKGATLSLADTLIAAVAIESGLILATDNRRDFPMPELRLVDLPGSSR